MQTIDKVVSILEVLLAEPELSASEIAARINMPVPTTHRILSSLSAKGILEKDIRTKQYSLGWALVRYAKNVRSAGDEKYNLRLIHPIMQMLSSSLGETVTLATYTGTHVPLIKVIEGSNPLRHCSEEGRGMPFNAAALPKFSLPICRTSSVRVFCAQSPLSATQKTPLPTCPPISRSWSRRALTATRCAKTSSRLLPCHLRADFQENRRGALCADCRRLY